MNDMHWLVFALLVVFASVGFNIFAKLSGGLIHPLYAGIIVQAFALLTSIMLFVFLDGMKHVNFSQEKVIVYSILAGVMSGIINIAIFYMYKSGAPISMAVPVTRIGVIVLAVIVGFAIFSETTSPMKVAGIALSFLSIFLMTR